MIVCREDRVELAHNFQAVDSDQTWEQSGAVQWERAGLIAERAGLKLVLLSLSSSLNVFISCAGSPLRWVGAAPGCPSWGLSRGGAPARGVHGLRWPIACRQTPASCLGVPWRRKHWTTGEVSPLSFMVLGLMFRAPTHLELFFMSCKGSIWLYSRGCPVCPALLVEKGCPFPGEWCRPPSLSFSRKWQRWC